MSEHSHVYQVARLSATIGAGIFTGLALSAPLYSLPIISSFSATKSHQSKAYRNKSQKLSPSDRLTLFQTIHETTGAITIPVAAISGLLYALAAYVSPANIAINTKYVSKAGEFGGRFVSDSFLTRVTAPRALLIGSSIALFSVIPISGYISEQAAKDAVSLSPRLSADAAAGTSAINGSSESEKLLDKQLAKWTFGTQLATLAGLFATIAGVMQLGRISL